MTVHVSDTPSPTKENETPASAVVQTLPERRGEYVEVNTALSRLERALRMIVGDEIGVELELNASPSLIGLDRERFERVISDLASRARDAMPHGGLLRIRSEDGRRGLLEVELRDTGTPMSLEGLEHMFKPYADAASRRDPGLATAFGILRQTGGAIVCETGPGFGVSFRVLVPAVSESRPGPRTDS